MLQGYCHIDLSYYVPNGIIGIVPVMSAEKSSYLRSPRGWILIALEIEALEVAANMPQTSKPGDNAEEIDDELLTKGKALKRRGSRDSRTLGQDVLALLSGSNGF